MKFNSVIIFLNNICSVGCASCNVSAKSYNSGVLDRGKLKILFSESNLAEISKYFVWTGGEPFLSFELLLYGLRKAEKSGVKSEILTSGIWFYKNPEYLKALKTIPNLSLRISLDAEHNKSVSHELLLKLIEESIIYGIDVNFTVRKIPNVNYNSDELFIDIKRNFRKYYLNKRSDFRWIHTIPHIPVREDDPYILKIRDPHISKSGCKFVYRDFVIGWDGFVYPCCGLFSVKSFNRFSLSELTKGFLDRIEDQVRNDRMFLLIKSSGPRQLIDKVKIPDKIMRNIKDMNNCFVCNRILDNWNRSIKIS